MSASDQPLDYETADDYAEALSPNTIIVDYDAPCDCGEVPRRNCECQAASAVRRIKVQEGV